MHNLFRKIIKWKIMLDFTSKIYNREILKTNKRFQKCDYLIY